MTAPDPCPVVIPTDTFVVGDIDFWDPVAVRRALDLTTFGHLFTDDAVAAACQAGAARDLFPNIEPAEDSFEVQALKEWIDPSAKSVMEIADLEERALFIIQNAIHGCTDELQAAIKSVAEAGIVGALAQANLREPMPRTRMGWPWWYRGGRRHTSPDLAPSLFELFEEG